MPKLNLLIAVCTATAAGTFALSAPQAYSEFTSTSSQSGNSVTAGSIAIELVDAAGSVQSSPLITVSDAYPAMSVRSATLRIHNAGSLPATVRLHSDSLQSLTAANLNDVLQLRVLNQAGVELYSGKIGALEVDFASLAAGSTTVLTIELSWPDLPAIDDNPYQEAVLTFGLVADASNLVA